MEADNPENTDETLRKVEVSENITKLFEDISLFIKR